MKKLISADPEKGKKTFFHSDVDGNHVSTEINLDPIIDAAKREANDWRPGSLIGNTQKHKQKVAEIPAPLYYQLIEKFGQPKQNPKAWRKWLNDYDNRFFRTSGGTV